MPEPTEEKERRLGKSGSMSGRESGSVVEWLGLAPSAASSVGSSRLGRREFGGGRPASSTLITPPETSGSEDVDFLLAVVPAANGCRPVSSERDRRASMVSSYDYWMWNYYIAAIIMTRTGERPRWNWCYSAGDVWRLRILDAQARRAALFPLYLYATV